MCVAFICLYDLSTTPGRAPDEVANVRMERDRMSQMCSISIRTGEWADQSMESIPFVLQELLAHSSHMTSSIVLHYEEYRANCTDK